MKLTQSQEIGVEKILKFLKSDQRIFRLEGPAGSGKTTMIKIAMQTALKKSGLGGTPDVVGITFSHKAKNVLSSSIPYAHTFASAYAFKEYIHPNGKREFRPDKNSKGIPIGKMDIPYFIHDEISQYSAGMMQIILNNTSMFSKMILMGDKAQLPPVNDSGLVTDLDSPLFDIKLPESCQHTLTERVRQKHGNPILDLSDMVREEIFGSQNVNRIIMEILKPKLYEGKGYILAAPKTVLDKYLESDDYLNNKIIAYRNEKGVQPMNAMIRSKLFPNTPEKIVPDDLVFMNQNFMSRDPEYRLNNADEYFVGDVRVHDFYAGGCDEPLPCYFALVKTKRFGEVPLITPTEEGEPFYNEIMERYKTEALKTPSLWPRFYSFKDSFCEYTMGYAITAYKAQGSTYKNVYVDLLDILNTTTLSNKRKLQTIYTAITRATDVVTFIKN